MCSFGAVFCSVSFIWCPGILLGPLQPRILLPLSPLNSGRFTHLLCVCYLGFWITILHPGYVIVQSTRVQLSKFLPTNIKFQKKFLSQNFFYFTTFSKSKFRIRKIQKSMSPNTKTIKFLWIQNFIITYIHVIW